MFIVVTFQQMFLFLHLFPQLKLPLSFFFLFVFFVFFVLFGNLITSNHSAVTHTCGTFTTGLLHFFIFIFPIGIYFSCTTCTSTQCKGSDKTRWHFWDATFTKEQYSILSIPLSCVMMTRRCHLYIWLFYQPTCNLQMGFTWSLLVVFLFLLGFF